MPNNHSTSPPTGSSPTHPSTPILASVAEALDALLVDSGRALAVGLTGPADSVEIVARPLDGHPVDDLIGFTAPDAWWGFGVAVTGHCLPLAGDELPPVDDPCGGIEHCSPVHIPPRGPVRVVHLVSRAEAGHTLVSTDDDEVLEVHPSGAMGLVDDVCRRVLGIRTSPPDCTTAGLWARLWLEAVITATDELHPLDWASIAALHPAVEQVRLGDPALGPVAAGELALCGRAMADAWSWEVLRLACAGGESFAIPIPHAAWMDDGMFSRMALSCFAELDDLVDAAIAQVSGSVGVRILECLSAWRLEPRHRRRA